MKKILGNSGKSEEDKKGKVNKDKKEREDKKPIEKENKTTHEEVEEASEVAKGEDKGEDKREKSKKKRGKKEGSLKEEGHKKSILGRVISVLVSLVLIAGIGFFGYKTYIAMTTPDIPGVLGINDIECTIVNIEQVPVELQEFVMEDIDSGGIRYLEYGDETYVVISSGNASKKLEISTTRAYNSLYVGYEFNDKMKESYYIVRTNLGKKFIKVSRGVVQVGISNMQMQCMVLSVSKENIATVFYGGGGLIYVEVPEEQVLSRGLYDMKFDGNQQLKEAHRIESVSMNCDVIKGEEIDDIILVCGESSVQMKIDEEDFITGKDKVVSIYFKDNELRVKSINESK